MFCNNWGRQFTNLYLNLILRIIISLPFVNLTNVINPSNRSEYLKNGSPLDVNLCLEDIEIIRNTETNFLRCCLLDMLCSKERPLALENSQTGELFLSTCNKLNLTKLASSCRKLNISHQLEASSGQIIDNKGFSDMSLNRPWTLPPAEQTSTEPKATTTAISISLEQLKMKEPTNDNLTRRSIHSSELQFLDIPKGDDLKIHELQLEDEILHFEAFSGLMGYLLPSEFPMDVFRDAFKNTTTFHLWIFQVAKLEILVIVWIIFWAILSLCLPLGVMALFCFPLNERRLDDEFSSASSRRATERTLGYLLHILLILMMCPVILILSSSEQISRSISRAPTSASIMFEDVNTFIRNSHMQLSFVTTSSTDITIEAIRRDLKDIDIYLGVPYQKQLASETGLDVALIALEDVKEASSKVSSIISYLLSDCESARVASKALQDEIQEIARQLVAIQQQCSAKDRPLCFTVRFSGFDSTIPLNNLTSDSKLQRLNRMNKDGEFNASIEIARKTYSAIPDQVVQESISYISDINSLLSRKRTEVYKSTHDLDILARTLSQEVSASKEAIFTLLEDVVKWDLWRWLTILGISAILALIWGFLICGAPCGCGVTSKTVPLLILGISLSCVICFAVWALGTVSFLLGGHGKSLICQPLYDHPRYETLSGFLDAGGILYNANGFFDEFSSKNDSVKVANVLNGCQRDQPAYHTFHLQNKIDLNRTLNHETWEDLNNLFEKFVTDKSRIEILSPALQLNLQMLASNTAANFSSYRYLLSSPITRRDLGSFADQLNNVARQLADPVISRKMDNLAFSVRKVVQNEMQRLNDLRGRILYKITKLEVLLPPLNGQVNQSLSHLRTIQFFLDNQGWQISERARRQFISKIENYLTILYDHVLRKITKEIGKCRPLWEIFHATRVYGCKLIFDPLNAIAFASYFLILVFIGTTPIVVKLVDFYREAQGRSLFSSISLRDSQEGLIIDEEQAWTSPSTQSPEEREMTNNASSTWVSPPPRYKKNHRRPPTISSRIPVTRIAEPSSAPYRRSSPQSRGKLAAITSRITGARNLAQQIPSISRARTPRRGHESLKLIEPIHWKSGSTTPKSWI